MSLRKRDVLSVAFRQKSRGLQLRVNAKQVPRDGVFECKSLTKPPRSQHVDISMMIDLFFTFG
jgi:hypothetical protein